MSLPSKSQPGSPSASNTTVNESAGPEPGTTLEKSGGDIVLRHSDSIKDKVDPWLVSFAPDDPDNPLVCRACPLLFFNLQASSTLL
jgi:hypothetical protein